MRRRATRNHLLEHKPSTRTRRLKNEVLLAPADTKKIKRLLGKGPGPLKGVEEMARVKRAVNAHKKRRVVLERASGYRGQRSRLYRKAEDQSLHSMADAYRDRKDRTGAVRR